MEHERMDTVALDSISPNPSNPRVIRDEQFRRLVESIKRDPQFLEVRGIVHADGVILGGNMRYRAIQECLKDAAFRQAAGVTATHVPARWVQDASDWDDDRRRRFVIVDNAPDGISGEWNWDALANEWDEAMLAECGLEPPGIEDCDESLGDCNPSEKKEGNTVTCPKCGFRYEQG